VIISGDLPDAERARLSGAGVVGFLDKPYAIGDMVALVKSIVTTPS
jgi:hypothetical protein